eukprot:7539292-Pyramimonas_sp.AAC.1
MQVSWWSKELVTAASVSDSVRGWLEDSNLSNNEWVLQGEPTSRKCIIRFNGAEALAFRRVAQALGKLKTPRPGGGAGH